MTVPPPPEKPTAIGRWRGLRPGQRRLIGFILIVTALSMAYRVIHFVGLQKTAVLYVGLPTILAVALVLEPRSRGATAAAVRGSLIFLAIATIILPEGFICIAFAAPLVVLVAAVVGEVVGSVAEHQSRRRLPMVGLPLLVLSLEGVVGTPFDPHATATATITVDASAAEVAAALARPPTFADEMPTFLRVGFNRPVAASGAGLAVGDGRAITFAGGSHDEHPLGLAGLARGEHIEDHTAQMHLRITESEPGRVVFSVAHDGTMLARWVDLDRAVVTWRETGEGTTEVTWSLVYERLLYPSFYFAPLQGYGMDRAAEYLLDVVVGGAGT